jgi:hypothetical protein
MEPVKEQWTDERLDDLNHRVSDGFNRIDADLRSIRDEIGSLRAETKSEIGFLRVEMGSEIGALRTETNARFDALQRTMLQLGGGMIATFVVGFAGLLATHA